MLDKIKDFFTPTNSTTVKSLDDYYEQHTFKTTVKENGQSIVKTATTIRTKAIHLENAFKALENNDHDLFKKSLKEPLKGVDDLEPYLIVAATEHGDLSMFQVLWKAIEEKREKSKDLFALVAMNAEPTKGIDYQEQENSTLHQIDSDSFYITGKQPQRKSILNFVISQVQVPHVFSSCLSELITRGKYETIEQIYKVSEVAFTNFEIATIIDDIEQKRIAISNAYSVDDSLTETEREFRKTKALSADGLNVKLVQEIMDRYKPKPQARTDGKLSAIEMRKLHKTMPDHLRVKIA